MEYMIQENTLAEIADALRNKLEYKDIVTSLISDRERLVNINIPNGVTAIKSSQFDVCVNLTSITIPESVTSIYYNALDGCTNLENITVAENNNYYSSENNILFNKEKTSLIKYPAGDKRTSYIIPSNIISIGDAAFYNFKNLTSITIPNSVTSIGFYAFSTIKNYMQKNIYLYSVAPPVLKDTSAFYQYDLTIHVPVGSGNAYKSATNWSNYADIIVEDIVVE